MKNKAQGRYSNDLHSQTSSTSDIKAEKAPDVPTLVQGADHAKAPRLPDASEVLANGEIMGLDFEVTGPKLLGEPARSTSILDKLFGNASTESDPLMVGNGSTSKFVEVAIPLTCIFRYAFSFYMIVLLCDILIYLLVIAEA